MPLVPSPPVFEKARHTLFRHKYCVRMRTGRWSEVYMCVLTHLHSPCYTKYLGVCKDFSKKYSSCKQALLEPYGTHKGLTILTTMPLSLTTMFRSTGVLRPNRKWFHWSCSGEHISIMPVLATHCTQSCSHPFFVCAVKRSGKTSMCIHMIASQTSSFA